MEGIPLTYSHPRDQLGRFGSGSVERFDPSTGRWQARQAESLSVPAGWSGWLMIFPSKTGYFNGKSLVKIQQLVGGNNPSHWLSYFSEGLKPPTSHSRSDRSHVFWRCSLQWHRPWQIGVGRPVSPNEWSFQGLCMSMLIYQRVNIMKHQKKYCVNVLWSPFCRHCRQLCRCPENRLDKRRPHRITQM